MFRINQDVEVENKLVARDRGLWEKWVCVTTDRYGVFCGGGKKNILKLIMVIGGCTTL